MSKRYIFGPVASRRLGISLGVDLVKPKTCTLDCIYCEAGATTELTCKRDEYVTLSEVKAELKEVLDPRPKIDYITFSGAGEPTLHSKLTELCQWMKSNYPEYRICLLTNGTLLNDPDVRAALEYIDLAMPNFDASNDEELEIINRPAAGITVETLAEGIRKASAEQPGKLVLELFIVPGVNDSDESIGRFVEYIKTFKGVLKVQLNTLDRPGVVDWIKPAGSADFRKFINALEPFIPVEAVGKFQYRSPELRTVLPTDEFSSRIIGLVSRRPATADDLALALDCEVERVQQRLDGMIKAGTLTAEKLPRGVFYAIP